MIEHPARPESNSDAGNYPGTPRWVKVFGIVVLALVLAVVVILVTGVGGEHGPRRHMSPGGGAGNAPPAAGVQQP